MVISDDEDWISRKDEDEQGRGIGRSSKSETTVTRRRRSSPTSLTCKVTLGTCGIRITIRARVVRDKDIEVICQGQRQSRWHTSHEAKSSHDESSEAAKLACNQGTRT